MALPPEADDQYKVPLIAKLLHSLPHFNITFHRINSTFKPRTELYLEVSHRFILKIFTNHSLSSNPTFALPFSESRDIGSGADSIANYIIIRPPALFDDEML